MLRREKWKLIIPFVLPGLLVYSTFTMYPAIRGLLVSFYRWSGLSKDMTFIGVQNYAKLWQQLTDPVDFYGLRTYLSHNAFLFVFSLLSIFLALGVAALINNRPFGSNVFRVTFFFPNVLSVAAIASLWTMVLNPEFGLVNTFLRLIGLGKLALPWLSMNYEMPGFRLGLYTIGGVTIWGSLGWFMILFLASIQNVPAELIESARLDGANEVRAFFSVTIPLIWETIRTLLILAVIGALNQFALVYIIFDQWPNRNTDMIMNHYYYVAFSQHDWGYAASIIVGILLVTMSASIFSYRVLGRETIQY